MFLVLLSFIFSASLPFCPIIKVDLIVGILSGSVIGGGVVSLLLNIIAVLTCALQGECTCQQKQFQLQMT